MIKENSGDKKSAFRGSEGAWFVWVDVGQAASVLRGSVEKIRGKIIPSGGRVHEEVSRLAAQI